MVAAAHPARDPHPSRNRQPVPESGWDCRASARRLGAASGKTGQRSDHRLWRGKGGHRGGSPPQPQVGSVAASVREWTSDSRLSDANRENAFPEIHRTPSSFPTASTVPTTSRGLCLRFARCSCTKVLRAPRRKGPSSCSAWSPSRRPGSKMHDLHSGKLLFRRTGAWVRLVRVSSASGGNYFACSSSTAAIRV